MLMPCTKNSAKPYEIGDVTVPIPQIRRLELSYCPNYSASRYYSPLQTQAV